MKYTIKANTTYVQVCIIGLVIFILRFVIVDAYSSIETTFKDSFFLLFFSIIDNYFFFIPMVVVNIALLAILDKYLPRKIGPVRYLLSQVWLILTLSSVATLVMMYSNAINDSVGGYKGVIAITMFTNVLINTVIVIIGDIFLFRMSASKILRDEKRKRYKAQHQYTQLKQQLNPHFLFNSLNILNALVQEKQTQRASLFINKLANVYRYLLSTDTQSTVPLNEEVVFLNLYTDLLHERFSCGLVVNISIGLQNLKRHVVPCGIQLLVENAIKHNVVTGDEPLYIEIYDEEDSIVVKNSIKKRISRVESLGLGLKNIAGQYKDIANKNIVIQDTGEQFIVKLPLLDI